MTRRNGCICDNVWSCCSRPRRALANQDTLDWEYYMPGMVAASHPPPQAYYAAQYCEGGGGGGGGGGGDGGCYDGEGGVYRFEGYTHRRRRCLFGGQPTRYKVYRRVDAPSGRCPHYADLYADLDRDRYYSRRPQYRECRRDDHQRHQCQGDGEWEYTCPPMTAPQRYEAPRYEAPRYEAARYEARRDERKYEGRYGCPVNKFIMNPSSKTAKEVFGSRVIRSGEHETRKEWDEKIQNLLDQGESLHVHTVILPPGVTADDPRLKYAKVVDEVTYTTDHLPNFPKHAFVGNIDPSLNTK